MSFCAPLSGRYIQVTPVTRRELKTENTPKGTFTKSSDFGPAAKNHHALKMKLPKSLLTLLAASSLLAAYSPYARAAVSLTTPNTDVSIANTDYTRTPSSGNLTAAPSGTQGGGSYTFSYGGFSGVATVASGGTPNPSFALTVTNNTGAALTSVTLSGLVALLKSNSTSSVVETLTASVTGISGFTVSSATAGGVASNSLNINTLTGSGSPATPITGTYSATISGFSLANGSSFTITWTDANDANTDAMFGLASMKVKANVVTPPNNSVLSSPNPSSVAFGRVMQNATPSQAVSLTKAGSDTTTYSATPSNNGITVTADGSAAAGAGTEPLTVALANNANGSSTTGSKSYSVVVDNLATTGTTNTGVNDPNETISVSATVLANRDITVTGSGTSAGSPVNLGKVFVGASTGTSSVTLSGGAQDDNNGTRVVISGSTSNGGVTAAFAGSGTFNGANQTKSVAVSGNFGSSGSKTGTVNAGALLSNGEAAGVGATVDTTATVNYTADVYQRADLTASNNATGLDDGGTVSVNNSDTTDASGQRAAVQLASKSVVGEGWSVTGLDAGTNISQNSTATGTANFDSVGKLNGTHVGSLVLGFQYSDSSIQGAGAASELNSRTWSFSHTVSGNVSNSGTATVGAGGNYANFGLTSTNQTSATLLSGTNATGSASDVTMSFSSSEPTAINDANRVSDVFNLAGTDESVIVLQLSYDESSLGSIDESTLRLGWLSGDTWVLAIDGNGPGSTPTFVLGAWNSSYALGTYGVDTDSNTVWAVINHNSEFSVVAVPEPGTCALLAVAGIVLVIFRRRRSAAAN